MNYKHSNDWNCNRCYGIVHYPKLYCKCGNKRGESKPRLGDWYCVPCATWKDSCKQQCFKCNTIKPENVNKTYLVKKKY